MAWLRGTWVVWGLAVLTLGQSGCIWNLAEMECDSGDPAVALGERDDGVSPDAIVRPLMTSHDGRLTWSQTGSSTGFHVVLQRGTDPSRATNDCAGNRNGFAVPAKLSVSSDDGIIADQRNIEIDIDKHQAVESVAANSFDLPFERLRDAGLTPPDIILGPSVGFTVALAAPSLTPAVGPVLMTVDLATRHDQVLGGVTFP